jgi:hypothetical protein
MVNNNMTLVKLPFMHSTRKGVSKSVNGCGMGSVLLRTGGPGSASSYSDIDDYIATTGINPFTRKVSGGALPKAVVQDSAEKLSKLSDKLGKLNITMGPKRKNITMSF